MMVELRTSLDAEPGQVALARHLVSGYVREQGHDEEDVAVLLVSELVTNAILHGRGPLELRARATGDSLRVEVHDADPRTAPTLSTDVGPTDDGGRGLQLVDILADRWGWAESPAGKVVWFELDS
ncbi:MAG: ATP-binding protein [Actinomycetia bacterium]|jgi:anti-sigma regulatory factor (Ser/Thr protein kinase)|nr:ATP-binding protein [Actinomycetes bacterium]